MARLTDASSGADVRAIIQILVDSAGDGMTCTHGGRLSRAEVVFWLERARLSFLAWEWGQDLPGDVAECWEGGV